VDVAAPGSYIYSTVVGGYGWKGGTSMATPFVSGLAALVLSMDSDLTPDAVETIIETSADDLGDPGRDDEYGWGRINASQAVMAAFPRTVEGTVHSQGGQGVAGVLLTIAGSQTFTATTGSNGHFGQSGLPWGTYIVTPALADLAFTPPTHTLVISNADVTGVAFTAQVNKTLDISGTVHTPEGNGCPDVKVVVASDHLRLTTLTDAQGHFGQSGLISDTYTLTPISPGHTFEPSAAIVELGLAIGSQQDFTLSSFIVSGTVRTSRGEGIAGVLMSLSEVGFVSTLTTTTDASGAYTFTKVAAGTYVLTPNQSNATFDPPAQTVEVTGDDQTDVDFTRNDFGIYMPAALSHFSTAIFPDDPYFEDGTQWGLYNTGQLGGTDDADIDAPEAWNLSTGEEGVIVAILDTGVDQDHPEFSGRLVAGKHYYSFWNGSEWLSLEDGNFDDDNGHGSHAAGIAAATGNNGTGVAGVAWNVRIMPVKVLDSYGGGFSSDVARGVTYAADQGARVINLSMGSTGQSTSLQAAIDDAYNKGVLVVASAGNCGDSNYSANGCSYQDQPNYPAAGSHVLAIASTDRDDMQSSFSNQGNYVDVAAPGSSIYSAYMGGGYTYKNGTSMSAPFVTGLAGLIYSRYPGYTPDQVAQAIVHNADDLGAAGRDDLYGCGRINAYRSLANGAVTSGCAGWSSFSIQDIQVQPTPPADAEFRPGVLLVRFRDAASLAERENVLAAHSLTTLNEIEELDIYLVTVPEGQELAFVEGLNADPTVVYAEPDYKVYALSPWPSPPDTPLNESPTG